MEKDPDIMKPFCDEHILPFPWHFGVPLKSKNSSVVVSASFVSFDADLF